jgi:hypothetical protein
VHSQSPHFILYLLFGKTSISSEFSPFPHSGHWNLRTIGITFFHFLPKDNHFFLEIHEQRQKAKHSIKLLSFAVQDGIIIDLDWRRIIHLMNPGRSRHGVRKNKLLTYLKPSLILLSKDVKGACNEDLLPRQGN